MNTDELKKELQKGRESLKTLGDEIRVRLHLAGMEAREGWDQLSREVEKVSHRVAHETTEATRAALDDLVKRMREFSAALKQPPPSPPSA